MQIQLEMKNKIDQLKSMMHLVPFLVFSILMLCKGPQVIVAQESNPNDKVMFVQSKEKQAVDVYIDGDYFTSYRYEKEWKKPVLFPLLTKSGKKLTRGYPIDPQPGERYDHPHHVGFWFNYGDVNGLDFWNNSSQRSSAQKNKYGEILHEAIVAMQSDEAQGVLEVSANWVKADGEVLLKEETTFTFKESGTTRVIDRETKLSALMDVTFADNKEGMVGVRVAKELEFPIRKPTSLLNEHALANDHKTVDTMVRTGNYLSSEGNTGKEVWSTRATWMQLDGQIGGNPVALVLIDHPDNVGYPTYWHARDYGLFAANPLGQKVFTKGEKELNFRLEKGKSVTFNYRLLVHEGDPLLAQEINVLQKEFSGRK